MKIDKKLHESIAWEQRDYRHEESKFLFIDRNTSLRYKDDFRIIIYQLQEGLDKRIGEFKNIKLKQL